MEMAIGQYTRLGPIGALDQLCPIFIGKVTADAYDLSNSGFIWRYGNLTKSPSALGNLLDLTRLIQHARKPCNYLLKIYAARRTPKYFGDAADNIETVRFHNYFNTKC